MKGKWILSVLLGSIVAIATSSVLAKEITIAVVLDGPGPEQAIVSLVQEELRNHTPRDTTVVFKSDPSFEAGWRYENARAALQAAFDDPEVDLVLAVGSSVTYAAARSETALAKPVVSTFVQRADVFKLPLSSDGESLKTNLSFIVAPQRAGSDIQAFRALVPFQTLHVAVAPEDLNNQEELAAGLKRYEQELGIELRIVPITTDIESSVQGLLKATAVYLTPLQRLSSDQRQELIDELTRQKIPTFSMLGHPDVEQGVLAGVTPDIKHQTIRRVALNLSRLFRGRPTEELPVLLSVDTRLMINARTAAAIGYYPSREARIFAEFLHPEALETETMTLNFADLFVSAEAGSASLKVADSQLNEIEQDQYLTRTALLPQVSANLGYHRADSDLTATEDATIGSLRLRQQIYDDSSWSAWRSSTSIYEGAAFDRESERLDVLADAGQAFYALAQAQAEYKIVAGDLRLTENNLEMARLRRDVGYSGREEVLRWEAVLAERRSSLFRSGQRVETSLVTLNQILGLDQSRRWTPVTPAIDPEVFPMFGGKLDVVFDNFSSLQRIREASVAVALENAPELRSLGKSIEAQDIQVRHLKRRYILPTFFLDASYSEQFSEPDGVLFPDEQSYAVSVNAAYPLFEGGRRRHDLKKARSTQTTLDRSKQEIEQRIEQRVRTAMHRCENSFPRIKFGIQAAEAAGENLLLVRDQYAEGTVNVTDLLDAQNQKLTADQFVNSAIYEFMGNLIELQRALSWFEDDHTQEEQDAFATWILEAANQ